MLRAALPFSATVFAASLVIITGPAACADALSAHTARHLTEPEQELQSVTENMSLQDYRRACRRNQRLIRHAVTAYSKDGLRSMGIPKTAINLMGVAARLAVDQDAKFALGNSKLMAIELNDVAAEDRSVLLGIKLRW